ncbi:hypothetical protein U1Q18_043073, partial [Sarracenia purpurea var. burkii]
MKAYAIALIVCGSVAVAVIVFYCLCHGGRKKKQSSRRTVIHNVTVPPHLQAHRDVGSGGRKD